MNGRIFAAVPAGVEKWPKRAMDTLPLAMCRLCGADVPYRSIALRDGEVSTLEPHVRAADARAVRKRICFGPSRVC